MIFKTPVDQLRAHALMLGDLGGAPVYWLHVARMYAELPGRPVMLLARAQTIAILRVEWEPKGGMRTFYREAGVFLEPEQDRLMAELKNPMTGEVLPVQTSFREGPAVFTHDATGVDIVGNTELDQKTIKKMPWTWHSAGSRVWMTNEDAGVWAPADPASRKVQARDPLSGRILQTWHADRRDVADRTLTSAPCYKSYIMTTSAWPAFAGDPGEPGCGVIRGIGTKLTPAQAAAYPEYARLRQAHPDFFAEPRKAS